MEEKPSNGVPQFATADYAPNASGVSCGACRRPISDSFYRVNGIQACAECTRQVQNQIPSDSQTAFARALLFGIGGAAAGCVLYVIVALATGYEFGIVSLAVGFLVGKAMQLGSRGVGGRRYQIAAALLTYLAVSLSALPIAIQHMQTIASIGLDRALGLILIGIASPFLALRTPGVSGIISLVILFVGIRFAWKLTAGRRLEVTGPHAVQPAPSPAA